MNPDENDENTKLCFNCRRNIPLCNHEMHSAYCHRNLILCNKCDVPFKYAELKEHQKAMHVNISCDDCFTVLEAIDLESHKLNNCPHRMKTCNYCNIDIEASSLMNHVDTCSSRTERCNQCGQFVMLKLFPFHRESHALKKIPNVAKPLLDDSPESMTAYPPLLTKKVSNITASGTARSTTRTTSMPTLRIRDPVMINHRVSPPAKRNNDQPQINTLNNNDNTNKDPKKNMPIVDTPSDDDELSTQGAYSIQNNRLNYEYKNYSDILQGVQLPCEFCQKMINSENLVLHETGCRPDLSTFHNILQTSKNNVNRNTDMFPFPPLELDVSSSDSELNLNTLSISSDDEDSDKTNFDKLPCEFCEKLISIKKLISHQIKCENVLMNDIPIQNNLDPGNETDHYDMHNVPSSNIHGSKRNLFKRTPALTKSPSSSLVFRNSDYHLLTFSGYETQPRPIPKLPRVRLNNKNRVDMDAVNNAARNNYKQFLSNSRLNHSDLERDNSNLYLNPSGGAIPKQKNTKSNNNRRVVNDLLKERDSDSSSD